MKTAVDRPLVFWLAAMCVLISLMVVVGGITRLTGSGLSIVEWEPIMGAIPPLNEAQWMEAFRKYQASPQFRLLNSDMTLGGFKAIFFWEYVHRLLGRLIGVVFLVPWVYFLARKRLDRRLSTRLGIAFLLGGSQGVLGWLMVMSGLANLPHVSHYRLAAHLSLALIILGYLFVILLDLIPAPPEQAREPHRVRRLRSALAWILGIISLQTVYGAFTAGLKAGFIFNTFPMMNGRWLPEGLLYRSPAWLNPLENPVTVQFIHRGLAYLIFALVSILYLRSGQLDLNLQQRRSMLAFFLMMMVQIALGLSTLLLRVPVGVAVAHQAGAIGLLLSGVWLHRALRVGQNVPK